MKRRFLAPMVAVAACGVPGHPLPSGPTPPGPPTIERVRAAPSGWEVEIRPPVRDLDGAEIDDHVQILVFADDPTCRGLPAARGGPGSPIHVPRGVATYAALRAVAIREGRAGPPSRVAPALWTELPPAPEAPLAFAPAPGTVELSWLPPPAPVTSVRILRDGSAVAEVPAAAMLHTDRSVTAGRHRYALVGLTSDAATAVSAPAEVDVPKE